MMRLKKCPEQSILRGKEVKVCQQSMLNFILKGSTLYNQGHLICFTPLKCNILTFAEVQNSKQRNITGVYLLHIKFNAYYQKKNFLFMLFDFDDFSLQII